MAYTYAGLFTARSFGLVPWIVPSVAIGVPIGAQIIRQMKPETFRRICMSFDAWVVAFGLSKLIHDLKLVPSNSAYLLLLGVIVLDAFLLYRFFSISKTDSHVDAVPGAPAVCRCSSGPGRVSAPV